MISRKDLHEDATMLGREAQRHLEKMHFNLGRAEYCQHLATLLPDSTAAAELQRILDDYLEKATEKDLEALRGKLDLPKIRSRKRLLTALKAALLGTNPAKEG